MKSEIRVEFSATQPLQDLIQAAYYNNQQQGKLDGKAHHLLLTPEVDDIFYTVVKGLNRATIKLTHPLIEGSLRCLVEDQAELKIYPINIYCVVDEISNKYIFY